MKNIIKFFLVLAIFILPTQVYANSDDPIVIHYFYDEYCTNCQEVSAFMNEELLSDYNVVLIKYDVYVGENDTLFNDVVDIFDIPLHYPMMVVGGTVLQGTVEIKSSLIGVIEYYEDQAVYVDIVDQLLQGHGVLDTDIIPNPVHLVDIPLIGQIDRTNFSLILGAVLIGLIDGFNPCAMWVLVFLITMLINLKSRKRIWLLGSTFILVSGLIYFVIMMSWLQIVVTVIQQQIFQIVIGVLAIVFAFFSIRHYWRQRQLDIGCEVTDEKQRSRLMKRIQAVVQKNNLWMSVLGIIGIAVTVNLLELACSAGLPVIYTSMLAYHQISQAESLLYIFVYVVFFMLDDLIIFAIAMITFKVTGISNRYAKYSSLIGGLIMLFIGLALVFFPSWLF